MRKLGILTVADRVVQASLKLVLEPVFEADFEPCSYGFRPNRRAHDAIAEIHHLTSRGYEWIAEADIEACFDQIDHSALCARIRERIKDKKIMALIKAFLKAGVMTRERGLERTTAGTPQGGVLSPLLANVALSVLDEHFMDAWRNRMGRTQDRAKRRRHGLACYKLVRYADDFVLVCLGSRADAATLLVEAAEVLAPMGLRLSQAKTGIAHIDEGFEFLGFWIGRRNRRGSNLRFVYTIPSRKAVRSIKARIKELTDRSTQDLDFDYLLGYLERVLRGWANYFRHGASKRVCSAIDAYTWRRIAGWLRRKHKKLAWKRLRRRFCKPGTWQFTTSEGRVFRGAASVAITRYRYRGTKIPTPWKPLNPTPQTAQ